MRMALINIGTVNKRILSYSGARRTSLDAILMTCSCSQFIQKELVLPVYYFDSSVSTKALAREKWQECLLSSWSCHQRTAWWRLETENYMNRRFESESNQKKGNQKIFFLLKKSVNSFLHIQSHSALSFPQNMNIPKREFTFPPPRRRRDADFLNNSFLILEDNENFSNESILWLCI